MDVSTPGNKCYREEIYIRVYSLSFSDLINDQHTGLSGDAALLGAFFH